MPTFQDGLSTADVLPRCLRLKSRSNRKKRSLLCHCDFKVNPRWVGVIHQRMVKLSIHGHHVVSHGALKLLHSVRGDELVQQCQLDCGSGQW